MPEQIDTNDPWRATKRAAHNAATLVGGVALVAVPVGLAVAPNHSGDGVAFVLLLFVVPSLLWIALATVADVIATVVRDRAGFYSGEAARVRYRQSLGLPAVDLSRGRGAWLRSLPPRWL